MKQIRHPSRQRGVAVVTALLLTTLAITIVASLFWQQQVQVRSIENQRLQLQKQWILRGALDWTRLILREDKLHSNTDNLGEPWAVPLAETRLDQYVENGQADADAADAALSGSIVDAQSRFNLLNLVQNGTVDPGEVAAFARLLTYLQLNPALAQATADLMAAAQKQPTAAGNANQPQPASTTSSAQAMDVHYVDDLLAVPGFTPEMLDKLKDYVVAIPKSGGTQINVNTAPAEVLAARIDTLSLSDATAIVASRQSAWFRDVADFTQRLQGKGLGSGNNRITVSTEYFLVNGNVRLNRAGMQMQALIERAGNNPRVLWIREY